MGEIFKQKLCKRMAHKHMNRLLISIIIREMQIKVTRYLCMLIRIAKLKRTNHAKCF